MSRNVIECCNVLFDTISEDCELSDSSRKKLRVLPEVDPEVQTAQMDFISTAKFISSDLVLNSVKVAFATYKEDDFLMLTGMHSNEIDSKVLSDLENIGIHLEEIKAGALLFFSATANLERRSNLEQNYLIENILSQQEDSMYEGHSVEDLLNCIESFCIFRIDSNSAFKVNSNNDDDNKKTAGVEIAYYICSHMSKYVRLPISGLMPRYRELLSSSYKLFKENIFLSLTSTHFKHAFLELYRCIEMLYSLPKAINLKKAIGFKSTAYELSKHCYKELVWKSKELDSIKAIFNLVDASIFDSSGISKASFASQSNWTFDNQENAKASIEKIAERIYLIRNQLVHQFDVDAETAITQSDWILLISLLSNVIEHSYDNLKDELPQFV